MEKICGLIFTQNVPIVSCDGGHKLVVWVVCCDEEDFFGSCVIRGGSVGSNRVDLTLPRARIAAWWSNSKGYFLLKKWLHSSKMF